MRGPGRPSGAYCRVVKRDLACGTRPRFAQIARAALVVCGVMHAPPASAQGSQAVPRSRGAEVRGVVYDSVARRPLGAAVVQLVAREPGQTFSQSGVADSSGRFVLANVPNGRYTIGFVHPMLDSLGIEPPLREVIVTGNRPVTAGLAIPSPDRLRAAICGLGTLSAGSADSAAVVIGFARKASDDAPAAGAVVSAEWTEVSIGARGVVSRTPRRSATAAPNGWFALCGLPSAGTLALVASRDVDSTGRIELQTPAARFVRRDLWLGTAHVVTIGDTAVAADSLAPPHRIHTGDGRLSGTVTNVEGLPIAGARVSIAEGPEVRADARGEWVLTGAPPGTQMLVVRAVSYYPERRAVDVLPSAPRVSVRLSTLAAVLDTVRVSASRPTSADRGGFEQRRQTWPGTYITQADVARRPVFFASDVFRMTPGVKLEGGELKMRSAFGEQGKVGGPGECAPALYVNGAYIPGIRDHLYAADIDMWVSPEEIAGIEVYRDYAPPQFQPGLSGCGSIVIWTKARERHGPFSLRRSLQVGIPVVAVIVLSLVLIR